MGNRFVTLCPTDWPDDENFEATYEVDEANYIGTGKFSVVHLCWKRHAPEKRYALKVINVRADDFASQNRIREEIQILQMVSGHQGIITLVDVDESLPNCIRMVMELCEGGELYDRIQQKQYYPELEAKDTVRNLIEAVTYIHSKGIMHRDLKPENILLASKVSNTDIKISDMGLAKISRDYPRRLPRSHSICGSDFYLAPEVIKQEEYGREIDIWAVGVITYVLLSGSLPFFHNVLHKLYRQIVERDLSFPEQAWKNVSKGALDFILRLMQVRAGDRLTAEQALNHPWLRGAGGTGNSFGARNMVSNPNSFGSFPTQDSHLGRSGSQNYYSSHASHSHRLEHAHKVDGHGGSSPAGRPASAERSGPPGATPYGAAPYGGAPNYYAAPAAANRYPSPAPTTHYR
eukprot:gnl/TRDRNA2_/TRDRNA2_36852_c0_seq1.p1 gnl/TRDRNA2_/TRDRNA2_36852_c0~~gnl/TRDRNA2_/TRDRNA2_36852_c0_seq1.p1  ORF type:complete len:404 (-),score=62.94 gnl/TRDRNA2_/TRDRNA2_36852_c0_seq1:46-1257(-)